MSFIGSYRVFRGFIGFYAGFLGLMVSKWCSIGFLCFWFMGFFRGLRYTGIIRLTPSEIRFTGASAARLWAEVQEP